MLIQEQLLSLIFPRKVVPVPNFRNQLGCYFLLHVFDFFSQEKKEKGEKPA